MMLKYYHVYAKATCPWCVDAVNLLHSVGSEFVLTLVENSPEFYHNVKKKYDWELIEEYIERHLFNYPSTESITPVSCKKCGRLLEYVSALNEQSWIPGYLKRGTKIEK